ncbi:MAG: hypothetical protein ACLT2T_07225 [Bilophila wadsworthia]
MTQKTPAAMSNRSLTAIPDFHMVQIVPAGCEQRRQMIRMTTQTVTPSTVTLMMF